MDVPKLNKKTKYINNQNITVIFIISTYILCIDKVGFPKIFYYNNSSSGCVIAMELLGTNLNKLFKKYSRFSAYTASTIGLQMVCFI